MINYIDYFIPEHRMSIEKVFNCLTTKTALPAAFETCEDGIAFFKNVLGLKEVPDATGMNEAEMLAPVLTRFFETNTVEASDIQWIILIGDELDKGSRIANLGHYIQHCYKLKNSNVIVISGNHCSNMEYALIYAKGMLESDAADNVLLLAINKLYHPQDRLIGSYAVEGDAAGLIFLSNNIDSRVNILGVHAFTNGLLHKADMNTDNSLVLCKNYMICLSGFIKKFRIDPKEFEYILIQNANHLLVTQCFNSLGFRSEQLFTDNLSAFGHLGCLDFIVNLTTVMARDLKPFSKIMSFGIGWAGSNIALSLEIK